MSEYTYDSRSLKKDGRPWFPVMGEMHYTRYKEELWEESLRKVKDGGPVIGVQIENEYGHVGGHRGEEGEAHMRRLTALAKEIGLDVPLYTATGWGGACIGDCLPVMGGYCESPWSRSI